MGPDELDALVAKARADLEAARDARELDAVRLALLGRSGELTGRLRSIGKLAASERKGAGARLNRAKAEIEELMGARAAALKEGEPEGGLDVSLPGRGRPRGFPHPIPEGMRQMVEIFGRMGFGREDGPEIETDFNNFEALNTPPDHPARDMQDTYYLKDGRLLRTQTSAVWVHVMGRRSPPIRIVCPGRVFRRDVTDATHSPVFHQVEGLWVDDRCRFSDLKGVLEAFLVEYFRGGTKVRFDPGYFPFTEPSTEVSIDCGTCRGAGCPTCKHTGWIELLGAGMVHPAILARTGGEYARPGMRGFAFGMGVERLVMRKYRMPDMRWLFDNDLRVLAQTGR